MYILAKFINFTLKDKWHLLFVFNIPNLFLLFVIKDIPLFIILEISILLLSFTTKRVSNVLVYNSIFHIVSMSLIDSKMFFNYDYRKEKDKISKIFANEFIEGILNTNTKYITCTTHKWCVENVFKNEKILEKYDLSYKEIGKDKHILEVLLLNGGEKYNIHSRIHYKVKLHKKST